MVNLCRSHITALEKVRGCLCGWTTTMTGKAINSVLTKKDYEQISKALKHINKTIEYLKKCNQEV